MTRSAQAVAPDVVPTAAPVRPASPHLPAPLEPVAAEIARLEGFLRDSSGVAFEPLQRLLDWVFAGSGKRIRPALVFTVGRLGPSDDEAVIRLAAAVETLHAATLVHDDLVDGALVRRGLPTLSSRWNTSATVLAGDWLFARAARFAADTGSARVVQLFARTLGTLTDGELRQLFGRRGVPTTEEYEYRIFAKTASLFETCTEAAAVLIGAGPAETEALACFGRELGMAFQIVDDILDFTSSEARLGKPVGSDLRAGTVTLPALLYLAADPAAAPWLADGAPAEGADIDRLIDAIRADAAVLDAARRAAEDRTARALAALEILPASQARLDLEGIARYAVERDF